MFENHQHGRESKSGTIIVTGASQGIGAGITKALLQRSYCVVANSRSISRSPFAPTNKLALVDGDIGQASTAEKLAATAVSEFGSIDGVVSNAGIFFSKPFIEYTSRDFRLLSATNLQGYVYITQLAVKEMLRQKTGGSITSITATTAGHPIAGVNGSVPMMAKGGQQRSGRADRQ